MPKLTKPNQNRDYDTYASKKLLPSKIIPYKD
jgi:hypothetical protein